MREITLLTATFCSSANEGGAAYSHPLGGIVSHLAVLVGDSLQNPTSGAQGRSQGRFPASRSGRPASVGI
jgi:hypothetical protein